MTEKTEMTTTSLRDRAAGVLLGTAVGDALGAGYEFGSAPLPPEGPAMIGGGLGGFAPGEWTDDTTMTWCVVDVAATGADLRSAEALTAIARRFRDWYETGPSDIGIQTAAVLRAAGAGPTGAGPTGAALTAAAAELHARTGRTAGNGSLMRTSPVALAHLGDRAAIAEAARAVSALTHTDPDAGDACVLWCLAIDHAVRRGALDVRSGLDLLAPAARERWSALIDEAEQSPPARFAPNGWVVPALQAAWSAIHHTARDPRTGAERTGGEHLRAALAEVIAVGDDTDTTAAIAGALLGACWGASAVPADWRAICHGYPGITGEDLTALADALLTRKA